MKFVLKGQAVCHFEDQVVRVQPGFFLLLQPGTRHRVDIEAPFDTELLEVFLSGDPWLSGGSACKRGESQLGNVEPPLPMQLYAVPAERKRWLSELFRTVALQGGVRAGDIPELQYFTQWLAGCRVEVQQQMEKITVVKRTTQLDIYTRLQRAQSFILKEYETDISLKKIGRSCSLAPSHLLKYFPVLFGITPHQMVIECRIARAIELLLQTDLTVSEVIQEVGFKNDSSFIRLFRNVMGVTPARYRMLQPQAAYLLTA